MRDTESSNKRYGVRDTESITKGMVCGIQSL